MKRARLEDLWTRWIEGAALAAEEQEVLLESLSNDRGMRDALLEDGELEGQLSVLAPRRAGSWSDDDRFVRSLLDRLDTQGDSKRFAALVSDRIDASLVPRRPGRRRLLSMGLGAAALAALAVVARFQTADRPFLPAEQVASEVTAESNPPAASGPGAAAASVGRVVEPTGRVYLVEGALKVAVTVGQAVSAARGILTVGANSSVRLVLPDGTDLDLGGDSFLASVGDGGQGGRIFLASGTLRANVTARAARPLIIVTPHAEAAAAGGRLTLTAMTSATRLRVADGQVRVTRNSGEGSVISAGQQALIADTSPIVAGPSPPGGLAVLLTSTVNPGPDDTLVRKRLEGLGFEIRVRSLAHPLEGDAKNAALIVISSSVESNQFNPRLRDLPVPVLCWEAGLFDDLGLTGADDLGGDSGLERGAAGDLTITDRAHPLAAGFSGTVRITAARHIDLHWGRPGPVASWVATLPGSPPRAGIFAYERGRSMPVGIPAPARRVGFFLNDEGPTALNEAGWALFDAAARWCSEAGPR